jgi:hypothetical protein
MRDTSLNINIMGKLDIDKFFNCFSKNGWSIKDIEGYILYLPLGDKDFTYRNTQLLSEQEILNIFYKKWKKNEKIGTNLNKPTIESTINVLLISNIETTDIIFTLDMAKKYPNIGVTDFSFYLAEIIPPLINMDVNILKVECVDDFR